MPSRSVVDKSAAVIATLLLCPMEAGATCQATQNYYSDLIGCSGSPTSQTWPVMTAPGSPCFINGAYSYKDLYCDSTGYHQTFYTGTNCSGTPTMQTFLPTTCDHGWKITCGSGCPALGPTPVPTPAPPRCMATWRKHTDTTSCADSGSTESMIVHLAPGSPCAPVTGTADSVKDQYCDSNGYHQKYYLGSSDCSGTPIVETYAPTTCLHGHGFVCGSGCPAFQQVASCQATQNNYSDLIGCSGSATSQTFSVLTAPGSPCFFDGAYSYKDIYCDSAGYHHTYYTGTTDCSGTPTMETFLPTTCNYGWKMVCGSGCPALGPTPAPTPAPPMCMATWRKHKDTTNCADAGSTESMIVPLAPGSPCALVTGTADSVKDQYCDSNGYHHKYYLGSSDCSGTPIAETYAPTTCLHGHGFVCGSGCPALQEVGSTSKQNLAWMILPVVALNVWGRAALILA